MVLARIKLDVNDRQISPVGILKQLDGLLVDVALSATEFYRAETAGFRDETHPQHDSAFGGGRETFGRCGVVELRHAAA